MDVRSATQVEPVLEHNETTKVWWLVKPREMFDISAGGHLELICEWEIDGGSEVYPHTHPTHEFYYILYGKGIVHIGDEQQEVGQGDLVYIPPDALHRVTTVSEHDSLRAVSFAVGVPGAGEIDYTVH